MALAEENTESEGGYGEGLASEADRTIARGALTDIQKATKSYQSTYDKLQAERQQQVQSQRQILDATIEKLMASRQPDGVTPLLAAASGFFAPTRTGGTGESFGNALSRLAPALEQEERQRTALAQNVGNLQFQGAGLEGGLLKERQGDLMRQIIESQKSGSRLAASLAKGPKENQMQAAVRLMNDPNTPPAERAIWQAYVTKHTERAPKEPKNEFGAGSEGAHLANLNRIGKMIIAGTASPDDLQTYSISHGMMTQPRLIARDNGQVDMVTPPKLPDWLPKPPAIGGLSPPVAPPVAAAPPPAEALPGGSVPPPVSTADAPPPKVAPTPKEFPKEEIAPGVFRYGVQNRDAPVKVNEGMIENAAAIRKISDALAELQKVPDAVGMDKAAFNLLPFGAIDRIHPAGVSARALIADIGSLKIHDRSGAAVTAAEYPRLKPFVPKMEDNAETVQKKLGLFMREYRAILRDTYNYYGPAKGFKKNEDIESAIGVDAINGNGGDKKSLKERYGLD